MSVKNYFLELASGQIFPIHSCGRPRKTFTVDGLAAAVSFRGPPGTETPITFTTTANFS
jgi:hypothetical protein